MREFYFMSVIKARTRDEIFASREIEVYGEKSRKILFIKLINYWKKCRRI